MSTRAESQPSIRQSVIQQQCVVLHLPTVASQCAPLAEQAERERQPYLGYWLSALPISTSRTGRWWTRSSAVIR